MLDFERVKDRGNKKWSMAMMLTEHVARLKDWYAEDEYIQQTLLDDWELEAIQMELELAYKRQRDATVTVWKKGKTVFYVGKISKLDYRLNLISVEGPFGEDRIPVADIIKVECME